MINNTTAITQEQPSTIASWAKVVCNAIDAREVDSVKLLALADISPELLNNPEGRIPVSKMSRLWTLAVEATGDEAFGLSIPGFVQPTTFHALGFSLMVSASLRDAWQRTQRYYQVVSDVLDIKIKDGCSESALCYVRIPGKAYAKEAIDAFVATMVRLSDDITANSAIPTKILLERKKPVQNRQFEALFPCDVYFEAGCNEIYYKNEDLDQPLPTANLAIALKNDEVVQNYLSSLLNQSLVKQVTEKIIALMAMGEPSQELIAKELNISSRQLQRKLKDESSSFRGLLENVRKDFAKNYLAQSQQSIIEIAYQLGFQDPSNFTRAFKRWFGVSPSTFRKQHHSHL
ncbi:AraC family transcriptional regulator [Alkalimarinus coralli]|uniref:AraC family transcriptional regulator n=1 Tax=Alkalimarinus coralli TaxID=2935863 RepID=UPI00202B0AF2|nr:AraC family transcriptional regulator [Alkalimarinus coralli]